MGGTLVWADKGVREPLWGRVGPSRLSPATAEPGTRQAGPRNPPGALRSRRIARWLTARGSEPLWRQEIPEKTLHPPQTRARSGVAKALWLQSAHQALPGLSHPPTTRWVERTEPRAKRAALRCTQGHTQEGPSLELFPGIQGSQLGSLRIRTLGQGLPNGHPLCGQRLPPPPRAEQRQIHQDDGGACAVALVPTRLSTSIFLVV